MEGIMKTLLILLIVAVGVQQVFAQSIQQSDAYYNRGLAYLDEKDYDKAISDFTEAIRLDPKFDAYFHRGVAYAEKGDHDKAISDYTEAIRLEPNDVAYYNRGLMYDKKRDHDRAISDYTEAIRLNPNYASAYYNRGLMYAEKEDHDKAIFDYTEAIRLNPNHSKAYNVRGLMYADKGDYNRAIADYESSLRINPNGSLPRIALEKIRGNHPISNGVFTDTRDGKKYRTVKIGRQIWMAENLNYNASGSKCYGNIFINCQLYGRLYNWETAKKACPSGWHLPSESEYEVLDKAVGGKEVAVEKLKAKSGWYGDSSGTNEFGFSALPGGDGHPVGSFRSAGSMGFWWGASEDGSSAYYRKMYRIYFYELGIVIESFKYLDKSYLFSVRCLKDYGI